MSRPESINRVLHPTLCCGLAGYVLSWLVHLYLKALLRVLSPFVIEGTASAICGGVLAAVFTLYFARSISRPILRGFLWGMTVLLTPFVIAAAGITSILTASSVLSVCEPWLSPRANQGNHILEASYPLMPLIWTSVLCWLVCWYYRARRGESLICLGPCTSLQSVWSIRSDYFRELLQLWGTASSATLTWMTHRMVEKRLGWLWSSQSCAEGAMLVLGSGLIASVVSLYLCRIVQGRNAKALLIITTSLMVVMVGGVLGFSGYFGYQTAIVLMRFVTRGYRNEIVIYGYDLFPPVWAVVVAWILCWHYKATHGGVSLLNFEPPPRYDAELPK